MIENFLISIIYILPVGGVSYSLFKFFLKSRNKNKGQDTKPESWKLWFSLTGAVLSAFFAIVLLISVWSPSVHLPFIVKILFFILMIPFGCLLAMIGGLGKAVEAGAGSASSLIDGALDLNKKDEKSKNAKAQPTCPPDRRDERR